MSIRSELGKINRAHTFYLGWFCGSCVYSVLSGMEPADHNILRLTAYVGISLTVVWAVAWVVLVRRRP